jgi:hypothetical protein
MVNRTEASNQNKNKATLAIAASQRLADRCPVRQMTGTSADRAIRLSDRLRQESTRPMLSLANAPASGAIRLASVIAPLEEPRSALLALSETTASRTGAYCFERAASLSRQESAHPTFAR